MDELYYRKVKGHLDFRLEKISENYGNIRCEVDSTGTEKTSPFILV